MEIKEITNTKELPKGELRAYQNETIESAVQKYKKQYGKEPEKAYIYGSYIYLKVSND